MGFSLREISNFFGRPVCLYRFNWGDTFWHYTSADRDITYGTHPITGAPLVWEAIPISDNGFSQGGSAQDFIVTLPRGNPIVDLFRSTPPSSPIALISRRFHKDDPDDEAVVYWTGTIGNVRGKDEITSEILGLPISKTMRRTGLRKCWERGCTNVLYDQDCRVNKDDFKTVTTITGITGTRISVASTGAFPRERYAGGFVEWEATAQGTIDRRAIESSPNDGTFELFGTTDRLVVGQAVTLYTGCDLTSLTCDEFYNNLPNYAGHDYMADKSPFDGNPVF